MIDNWFVCGLSGTGSKDIVVEDVFVPAHRVLKFADTRAGAGPGARHHDNPIYRIPLLMLGASMLASTAIGAAKGALDAYLEMTSGRTTRGALAGGGLRMKEFATVQLRLAEAASSVEAAELILLTDMRDAMEKLRRGRGDHGRRPHPRPAQPGLCHQAGGAGGRGAERLDRRLRAASRQSGAARLARRQRGRPPCQPQLGRGRHDVRSTRVRPRAEGTILIAWT